MGAIHQFVVEQLQARKGQWPAVAKASKVPHRTLEKIATRVSKDPHVGAIDRLVCYFGADKLIEYLMDRL